MMEVEPDEIKRRIQNFNSVMKQAGLKNTPQRLQIFREVARTIGHPDAVTIWKAVQEAMPNVSLDTIYRTLWLFIDLGLISSLKPAYERMRFDANSSPHHHFRCTKCDTVQDFYSKECDRLPIPDSVKTMGRVIQTHVQLSGICLNCLKESITGHSPLRDKEQEQGKGNEDE
jgi:Fur family peroxide stress response transcriptional regulator